MLRDARRHADRSGTRREENGLKALSGLLFIVGISFFANAAAGQWAFNFSKHAGRYIALDVLLGLACWFLSWLFWAWHTRRSLLRGHLP
jgi:hypothetical protein